MDYSHITLLGWVCGVLAALFIGMGKTGLSGAGNLAIPLMVFLFGGKPSTGIILPLLCMADVFAVVYYHRHADWKQIFRILPWAIAGVLVAVVVGKVISDHTFKTIIAVCILISVALMFWQDIFKREIKVSGKHWYSGLFGLTGGFATMIGNAAGPIMAIYLQSMKLPKNVYIGTGAWFFLIVNYSKIPFQVLVWKNITWASMGFDLMMLPAIALGAWMGIKLVKLLPDKHYRMFILISTAISALLLF